MKSKQKLAQKCWCSPIYRQVHVHNKIILIGNYSTLYEKPTPIALEIPKEEYIGFPEPLPYVMDDETSRDDEYIDFFTKTKR